MKENRINQKIKKLNEKIDNILKKEIEKEDFQITDGKLEYLFNLIKRDINEIFILMDQIINKDIPSEDDAKDDENRKKSFFMQRLKYIFSKLHFVIKLDPNREYIIFKGNECVFIAQLVANFRIYGTLYNETTIKLKTEIFNSYVEEYKINENFINKLKEREILKDFGESVEIQFFDSNFSNSYEEDLFKELLLESNLKKNKELQNKLKTLEDSSAKLENSLNNYKLEGVAILTIFIGIFTYLSANFSVFQNLLTKNYTGNLLIVITIFCIGLIPIIVLFLILKYLFFTPNNNKIIWNILGLVAFMCIIILGIIFSFNKLNINYDCDLEKLNEKIEIQEKQIKKLNDELNFLKNKNIFLQDQTLIIYRDDK